MLVESVTSAGVRGTFEKIKGYVSNCSIVLTSKGIEQNTGLTLSEVVLDVLGEQYRSQIGCISGPSLALEVARGIPTSVVCSGYDEGRINIIQNTFFTPNFRVYPNKDISGVEFGGAMKNVIAIACGISDGLGFGANTKAAIMTRGLHEMRKLGAKKGCKLETLNGLSGMGDLSVTCMSNLSRNYRFGYLIAKGYSPEEARKKISVVVEGAYTCVSTLQLGNQLKVDLPITEAVYNIIYNKMDPKASVKILLQRTVKEEHL